MYKYSTSDNDNDIINNWYVTEMLQILINQGGQPK